MKKNILFIILIVLFLSINFCRAQSESVQNLDTAKIYLQSEIQEDQLIKIKIIGENIKEPVLGIAFDLIYDAENLEFKDYLKGSFFERGGDPIYLVSSAKKNEGRILVGVSLRRGDELPAGSGEIISFIFKGLKSELSFIDFDNATLASLDSAKKEIKDIAWVGSKIESVKQTTWLQDNLMNVLDFKYLHLFIELFLILLIVLVLALKTNLLEKILKIRQHNG